MKHQLVCLLFSLQSFASAAPVDANSSPQTHAGAVLANETPPARTPNIIVLLTDDLGYGDVGCYGAKPGHLKTPNIDHLAAEGIRLTDGHSASSVCTPSRYSLLTGDYAYRGHPHGSSILPGDAPLAIKPGSFTLPAMFKSNGYATGFIGKWHLGLGELGGKIDWNGEIKPGQLYDLSNDLAENNDLAGQHPERAKAMKVRLDELSHSRRTR